MNFVFSRATLNHKPVGDQDSIGCERSRRKIRNRSLSRFLLLLFLP
jgi:hypothetical protein